MNLDQPFLILTERQTDLLIEYLLAALIVTAMVLAVDWVMKAMDQD